MSDEDSSDVPPLPRSQATPRTQSRPFTTPKKGKNVPPTPNTSTPTSARTSSLVDGDRFREEIYPFLRDDLKHQKKVIPFDMWVELILNAPRAQILRWTTSLSKPFRDDEIILTAMEDYCTATLETKRYDPWTRIANQIVSTAHKYIPDIPARGLPDLFFVRNDPVVVKGRRPHYAQRKPDVLAVLHSTLIALQTKSDPSVAKKKSTTGEDISGSVYPTSNISWLDIISCVEFKAGDQETLLTDWTEWVLSPQAEDISSSRWEHPHNSTMVSIDRLDTPIHAHLVLSSLKEHPEVPSQPDADDMSVHTSNESVIPSRDNKRKSTTTMTSASKKSKPAENEENSQKVDVPQSVEEQVASYALELLGDTSGIRRHCLLTTIDGPELQLWYYDAGGIIQSGSMNWIKEFPKFAAIMVAFASLDASGWGVGLPTLVPPSIRPSAPFSLPTSLEGYSTTMSYPPQADSRDSETKVQVILGKEVMSQYSLLGRRTTVYEVSTNPKISNFPLVLKMSMQAGGRIPEYELLNEATAKGVEHLPKALTWTEKGTEWRLSSGIWGKVFPNNEGDREYEERHQRIIIFAKYIPLENVINAANMHNVFLQLIDCEYCQVDITLIYFFLTLICIRTFRSRLLEAQG